MNSIIFFYFASFWLAVLALPQHDISKDQSTCPENYSPCTCEKIISDVNTSEGWSILCERVPISKIQSIFNKTKARDLVSFKLTIEPLEKSPIPADFLGSSRSAGLDISCEGTSYNLIINENAFRLSKNIAKQLSIRDCDLKNQTNFAFLSGFQALAKLDIDSSRNLNSFQGLPSQSQLSEISISNSTGLQNMTQGQNIALPGLRALYLQNNQMDDQTLAKILKILAESSKTSLTELKLDQNKLTRIPELVSSLTKLENFFIDDNLITSNISQPGNNSLPVLNPYGVGNYQSVRLDKNRLTRFESYIFQGMLEGMEKSDIASLSIYENPIECDCHLAWLIRHKRNLLPLVIGGHCSNSTSFEDLNPDGFKHCRVFSCPPGVDGRFRNPISCSSYYRCSVGKISLVGCPKDRLFNTSKQKCDLSINVPTTCNQLINQKEL